MIDWYGDSHKAIVARFDKPELFIDLLAITSSHSTVKGNIKLAMRAYYQLTHDGWRREGFIRQHYEAIIKYVMTGKVPGRKCSAFAECLKNPDAEAVPVDIWLLRAHGIHDKRKPTKAQYDRIEQAVQAEARRIGVKVRDYHISLWLKARGKSDSYADYLK